MVERGKLIFESLDRRGEPRISHTHLNLHPLQDADHPNDLWRRPTHPTPSPVLHRNGSQDGEMYATILTLIILYQFLAHNK